MTNVSIYDRMYDNAKKAKHEAEKLLDEKKLIEADVWIGRITFAAQEFQIAADTLEKWYEELTNRHFDLEQEK